MKYDSAACYPSCSSPKVMPRHRTKANQLRANKIRKFRPFRWKYFANPLRTRAMMRNALKKAVARRNRALPSNQRVSFETYYQRYIRNTNCWGDSRLGFYNPVHWLCWPSRQIHKPGFKKKVRRVSLAAACGVGVVVTYRTAGPAARDIVTGTGLVPCFWAWYDVFW